MVFQRPADRRRANLHQPPFVVGAKCKLTQISRERGTQEKRSSRKVGERVRNSREAREQFTDTDADADKMDAALSAR